MENKMTGGSVDSAKPKRILHAAGIAHEYADPSKIELEKTAWQEAVMKKYSSYRERSDFSCK